MNNFEETVGRLKEPILAATDIQMSNQRGGVKQDSDNIRQRVDVILKEVRDRMSELHTAIKSIIDNNGNTDRNSLHLNTINQVFLQSGVNIQDLCKDPASKEALLSRLHVLLLEYPYTRSPKHARKLKESHTNPVSNVIIPNTDETYENDG